MSENTTPKAAPALPEKPRRSKTPLIAGGLVLVAALAAGGWALTRGGDDADVIRIGTTEASQPQWQILKEKAAAEGIEVELPAAHSAAMIWLHA